MSAATATGNGRGEVILRLEDGYDAKQVDDFLAALVDLDPHAEPVRPAAARSGLVTKLFG